MQRCCVEGITYKDNSIHKGTWISSGDSCLIENADISKAMVGWILCIDKENVSNGGWCGPS